MKLPFKFLFPTLFKFLFISMQLSNLLSNRTAQIFNLCYQFQTIFIIPKKKKAFKLIVLRTGIVSFVLDLTLIWQFRKQG